MFVIGKASDKEIKEMEEMGWDVEPVDIACFNAALNSHGNFDPKHPSNQPDIEDEEHPDKFVSVYIDCDIIQELRSIQEEENA